MKQVIRWKSVWEFGKNRGGCNALRYQVFGPWTAIAGAFASGHMAGIQYSGYHISAQVCTTELLVFLLPADCTMSWQRKRKSTRPCSVCYKCVCGNKLIHNLRLPAKRIRLLLLFAISHLNHTNSIRSKSMHPCPRSVSAYLLIHIHRSPLTPKAERILICQCVFILQMRLPLKAHPCNTSRLLTAQNDRLYMSKCPINQMCGDVQHLTSNGRSLGKGRERGRQSLITTSLN